MLDVHASQLESAPPAWAKEPANMGTAAASEPMSIASGTITKQSGIMSQEF